MWSFCHFGTADFLLLNRFSEIPSSEIIPYCFSHYFLDSHRLSFILFSLLTPLIFITDPSLAPTCISTHRALLISPKFRVLRGCDPFLQATKHFLLYTSSNSIWVYGLSSVGCLTTGSAHNENMDPLSWINSSCLIFCSHGAPVRSLE